MADNINIIIFFVYFVLYYIGFKAGAYLLIIGAGILLLGVSTQLTLFANVPFNVIFGLLLGIFTIYHAIFLIQNERK